MENKNLKFAFYVLLIAINYTNILTYNSTGLLYIFTQSCGLLVIVISLMACYKIAFKK